MRNFFRTDMRYVWVNVSTDFMVPILPMHLPVKVLAFYIFVKRKCAAPPSIPSSMAGRVTYSSPVWNSQPLSKIFTNLLKTWTWIYYTLSVSLHWTFNLTANLCSWSRYSKLLLVDCLCCGVTFLTQHSSCTPTGTIWCFCVMFGAGCQVQVVLVTAA